MLFRSRELRHQFDWEQAQVPYLGKVKNEARRATLPAKTGAIFFQSFATCHKQLSHDSGAYDEGLAPSFVVATEPFQFELPELGNLMPFLQNVETMPHSFPFCLAFRNLYTKGPVFANSKSNGRRFGGLGRRRSRRK